LTLLVEGHNFKTAAEETGVSPSIVAWHMRRVYDKLHVHSKSEDVAKALHDRIV
jgi:DNA-binding NarL/FixJ family response regulator